MQGHQVSGKLIVVEGLDKVGKETQTKMLAEALTARAIPALRHSFPDRQTPLGTLIYDVLEKGSYLARKDGSRHPEHELMFQCLQATNRYELAPLIEMNMVQGTTMVLDRWCWSAVAYGGANGLDTDWLQLIFECLVPADLVILLKVSKEERAKRRAGLGQEIKLDDYEKREDMQAAAEQKYLQLFEQRAKEYEPGETRWIVVDGDGSAEQVHQRIWRLVEATCFPETQQAVQRASRLVI